MMRYGKRKFEVFMREQSCDHRKREFVTPEKELAALLTLVSGYLQSMGLETRVTIRFLRRLRRRALRVRRASVVDQPPPLNVEILIKSLDWQLRVHCNKRVSAFISDDSGETSKCVLVPT